MRTVGGNILRSISQAGKQFFKNRARLRSFEHRQLPGSQNCLSGIILNRASCLPLRISVCHSSNDTESFRYAERKLSALEEHEYLQIPLHPPQTSYLQTVWVEQASQLNMLIRPLHSRDKSSPLCHLLATCTEASAGLSCSCDLSPDPTTVSVRTQVGYWPGSPEHLPGAGELGVGIEARRR